MVDVPLKAVAHLKLHDDLVNQIRELIVSEHLQPGDKLPAERQLAETCGVSRPVVREALRILERDGVVRVKAGSGAYVARPSAAAVVEPLSFFLRTRKISVEDLLDVRKLLEPEIAGRAAERRRPEHLAAMEAAFQRMEQTLGDPEQFIAADQEFHAALAEAAGNPLYAILLEPITDLLQAVRRLTETVPGPSERSQQVHRKILQRVRRQECAAARRAMSQHIQEKEEEIRLALARGRPANEKGTAHDQLA
jgi:GntR family transcriptional regulator, transcriptional repressor for pyruvate dehydrogenase complex